MSMFRYTHAIVCRIPDSYAKSALGNTGNIDLALARKQHESYVKCLRDVGIDVIELPPDEAHPDCLFVEDTAIVCNGSAIICNPAEPSRKGEVEYMRNILKSELQIPVMEIEDKTATLEGGDVLFTGKELFVGLSSRTNEAGARALAKAFPDFPCSPIKIDQQLHLKSMMSMAGPDVICVGDTPEAKATLKRIENMATFTYKTLTVPDMTGANVLFANGLLIHNDAFPESSKVFREKMSHYDLKALNYSEMAKANGCLTCCSILVKQTKLMKRNV